MRTTGARLRRTGLSPFLQRNVVLWYSPTMYFQTSLTPILVMPLSYQMCIHSRSPVSTFRQATVTNAGTPSSGFTREILMGEGFIIYGRGAWFAITTLYETKTHTDYYCQVAFHKLASIKFFDKNPMTPQSIFFQQIHLCPPWLRVRQSDSRSAGWTHLSYAP